MSELYLTVDRIGNNICERYIGEDGTEHRRKVQYEPTLFVHTKTNTGFKDIYNNNCLPRKFNTMGDAGKWKRDNEEMVECLGMDDFQVAYISDNYRTRIPDMSKVRVGNLDIEVPAPEFPDPMQARYEIKTVVHYDSLMDQYHMFGIPVNGQQWIRSKSVIDPEVLAKVVYHECQNEKELLIQYLLFWREFTPVIVTGWNIESFDMPYIGRRIERVLGEKAFKALSPWGKVGWQTTKDDFGNETQKLDITGVQELDYLALYRKFTFKPRPNFRLDYIGLVEVGQQKLSFEQSNYLDFYNEDYQRFCDYNCIDVHLVKRIDGRLLLLQLAVTLGYYAGINFGTVFGTLKPWDAIIFNSLRKDNKVVPMQRRCDKRPFIGAFVKDPTPGFYRDILSFDFTSLYPSIICQCNISPETIYEQFVGELSLLDQIEALVLQTFKLPHGDYSASANGMLYTKEFAGVIPVEITKVFLERKEWKKKMLEAQREAELVKQELEKRGIKV